MMILFDIGDISFKITRLFLSVGTCATFVPALQVIMRRRRHFELFVGVFQLVGAVLYSFSDAIGSSRVCLLTPNDWHIISDIMTETYVCLICIHLMGLRSEDHMILLRYIAFAGSWIAKLADGWGSILYEVLLLVGFILPVLAMCVQCFLTGPLEPIFPISPPPTVSEFLGRNLLYEKKVALKAVGCSTVGLFFLILELYSDTPLKLFNALAHCAFGAATFFLWQFLPCYDKSDQIPMFR
mmetsp:Transcript_24409/g.55036  ORF Transcript_24409/g.55036 Transcript_24409/m.55036 type:complete len:240 (+) Transcript_24409:182-901(+)